VDGNYGLTNLRHIGEGYRTIPNIRKKTKVLLGWYRDDSEPFIYGVGSSVGRARRQKSFVPSGSIPSHTTKRLLRIVVDCT